MESESIVLLRLVFFVIANSRYLCWRYACMLMWALLCLSVSSGLCLLKELLRGGIFCFVALSRFGVAGFCYERQIAN